MKPVWITLMAASAAALISLSAAASEDCGKGAAGKTLTEQEVRAKVEAQGYKVKRIKQEHGCYEVKAQDGNGQAVELKLSAADGTVAEEEDED